MMNKFDSLEYTELITIAFALYEEIGRDIEDLGELHKKFSYENTQKTKDALTSIADKNKLLAEILFSRNWRYYK